MSPSEILAIVVMFIGFGIIYLGNQQANPRIEAGGYILLGLICLAGGVMAIIQKQITLSLDENNSDHRNRGPKKFTGATAVFIGVVIIGIGAAIFARAYMLWMGF